MQIIHRNKKRFQKQCGQNGKTFEMLLGARSVSKVPESGKRRRVYRRQEKISLSGMISDDINRDPDEYSLGSDLPTLQTAIYEENEVQTLMRTVPNNLQLEDKSDFNYLDEALRRLSREIEFTEVGGNEWKFPGVKQCLKMHQVLGVAFMRRRELSSIKPRGGLLADEMGFGSK